MKRFPSQASFPNQRLGSSPQAWVIACLVASLALSSAWTQEPKAKSKSAKQPAAADKAAAADKTEGSETPASNEPPLYEQEPFDLITLDEASKNAQIKVMPLPFHRIPNASADSKLTIRLLDNDEDEYEIAWRNIRKVELYEDLLLKEGNRLVQESASKTPEEKSQLLGEAYFYFYRVQQSDPKWPNLKESYNRYLYFDAANLAVQEQYNEAFAILEDLYQRDSEFRLSPNSRPVGDVLSLLLDRILARFSEQNNYLGMRSLIKRMVQKYAGQRPASVDAWALRLSQMAAQKRDEGRAQLDQKDYRAAISSVKAMNSIWPDVEGGQQLEAEVARAYPIVFVGVTQVARDFDAQRLDNWGARRTGRLVHRTLVEFLGAGPEGGQYQLSLGSIEHSDDRRQLILRLRQTADQTQGVTGYDVARRLLELATTSSPDFDSGWASLVASVEVQDVFTVIVNLRHPHVLPEAFLRVPLAAPTDQTSEATGNGDGPYKVQSQSETETQFANKSFLPGAPLAELVEVSFTESQKGLGALRRGEIDVFDRVFPADALRLRAESSSGDEIRIDTYSLPTVHLLVPNLSNPFLENRDFRRAVLLAINRENILHQELMGGRDYPGFQVISGPFPARAGEADPLGYAYDEETMPLAYSPFLAKTLTIVAAKQVTEMAAKRKEPEPKLGKLVLGFPGHEMARVACQAIAAQLQVIGLEIELREFPPGITDDPQGDADLVYREIAIWEPVTDARRMLGPKGFAPTQSPYVQQSLRWLDEAENWSESRDRLVDIHRAVYNDVAVLPLWQTVDFFAYHNRLKNIGSNPVWLYQNVDQWRVSIEMSAE